MEITAFYLVTKAIAIRSGLVDRRYRTLDGRYILDSKDLARVRFTPDEYISGLDGVVKISEAEAKTLIAKGGYKKGIPEGTTTTIEPVEPVVENEEVETPEEEAPVEEEETSEEESVTKEEEEE